MEMLYHLTKSEDLSLPIVEKLFQKAEYYEEYLKTKVGKRVSLSKLNDLEGVRVYIVFFEESTRTYSTFYSAARELGALVTGIPLAKQFSGFAKEESLKHMIEFWSGAGIPYLRLADIIVIRHFEADAAERAAKVSKVPIINAGTGGKDGHHPTQALLDGYGFRKFLGKRDSLKIAFVGDLRFSRIIPSELPLLSILYPKLEIYFVAPEGFRVTPNVKNFLNQRRIPFGESSDIKEVVNDCDLCYMLRVQKNRLIELEDEENAEELLKEYQKNRDNFAVTGEVYRLSEKRGTIFCHPGPIDSKEQEIRPEVENLSRVKFLSQWAYGYPVRMALLVEAWETQKEIDLR